jgi:hypothetical protein
MALFDIHCSKDLEPLFTEAEFASLLTQYGQKFPEAGVTTTTRRTTAPSVWQGMYVIFMYFSSN